MESIRDKANDPHVVVPYIRREENHCAAGFEYAMDFPENVLRSFQMFQHPRKDNDIEKCILKREPLCIRNDGVFNRPVLLECARIRIDTVRMRSSVVDLFEKIRVTATNIENTGIRIHLLPYELLIENRTRIPFGVQFFEALPVTFLAIHF